MTSATQSSASDGRMFSDSEMCESAERTISPDATLSLAASRVRTYLLPGKARVFALARGLVFGSNSPVLLANYDRALSCWRTCQLSLPGMGVSLLEALPRWGMTQDGALYQRQVLEPAISANDGGVWPTPVETDHSNRKLWGKLYRTKSGMIRTKSHKGDHFVRLSQTVKLWPTPNTVDARGGDRTGKGQAQLCHQAAPKVGNMLNPDWVEALMGFPPGWTNPTIAYTLHDLGSLSMNGSRPASPTGETAVSPG